MKLCFLMFPFGIEIPYIIETVKASIANEIEITTSSNNDTLSLSFE